MNFIIAAFTLTGFSFGTWGFIGILRLFSEKLPKVINEKHIRKAILFAFLALALMHISTIWILIVFANEVELITIPIEILLISLGFTDLVFGGYIHYLTRKPKARKQKRKAEKIRPDQVATLTPAHNEEITIGKTINSLKKILPVENIYVGSDASTDRTIEIVQSLGANVVDIQPNRGKASALAYTIDHFNLLDRYKAVLIVDADSEVNENYLDKALPLFEDPNVVAVAGHAISKWQKHMKPEWSKLFSAYRVRFYRVLQAATRYGQTWKYTNTTVIVPGFSSMYKTSALRSIEIDAPNLIIEDFNMTFEVHHKRLGKIAYTPQAQSATQDPQSLKDYIKQIKRWNLGFWQTVRRHGIWPSLFWLSTGAVIVELLIFGIFFLMLPVILVFLFMNNLTPILLTIPFTSNFTVEIGILNFLIGVLLVDYLLTVIVAIYERKPVLLIYGLGFIPIRFVDAFMLLFTLPLAFIVQSDGKWVSPKRHELKTALN